MHETLVAPPLVQVTRMKWQTQIMKCNFEHKRNINSKKEELFLELMNKFWKEKGRGGGG